jgi:hypothetical protein
MRELARPKSEGAYYAARDLWLDPRTVRRAGEHVPEAHDWTLTPSLVRRGQLLFRPADHGAPPAVSRAPDPDPDPDPVHDPVPGGEAPSTSPSAPAPGAGADKGEPAAPSGADSKKASSQAPAGPAPAPSAPGGNGGGGKKR